MRTTPRDANFTGLGSRLCVLRPELIAAFCQVSRSLSMVWLVIQRLVYMWPSSFSVFSRGITHPCFLFVEIYVAPTGWGFRESKEEESWWWWSRREGIAARGIASRCSEPQCIYGLQSRRGAGGQWTVMVIDIVKRFLHCPLKGWAWWREAFLSWMSLRVSGGCCGWGGRAESCEVPQRHSSAKACAGLEQPGGFANGRSYINGSPPCPWHQRSIPWSSKHTIQDFNTILSIRFCYMPPHLLIGTVKLINVLPWL